MSSSCNEYDAGDSVRIRGTFKVDDEETDPTTVRLLILPPGEETSMPLAPIGNPSVGVHEYVYAIPLDAKPGFYGYRMEGTGAAAAGEEKRFKVRTRSVPEPA